MFGFGFGFGEIEVKNLREEKSVYFLPNPNLSVRFLRIQLFTQI
jgi:hypothetical protein